MDVQGAHTRAMAFLDAARNPDGSFGYLVGGLGVPEATLLAAAAGSPIDLGWLSANDLDWGALLLPAALSKMPAAAALCAATAEKVAARASTPPGLKRDAAVLDLDPTIPAWAWKETTFPWVEPTAYSVLSLRLNGRGDLPCVTDGKRFLRDRQCADGGWNYGNPRVMGTDLESEAPTTAWATLALGVTDPAGQRGLQRLAIALQRPSSLSLALSALVSVLADPASADVYLEPLLGRQQPNGGFGSRCDWTALAALALRAREEGTHVFAV